MNEIKEIYDIETIATSSKKYQASSLTAFLKELNPTKTYDLVCWQHQGVYRGKIINGRIIWQHNTYDIAPSLEDKYWQRARIFTDTEEYYIQFRSHSIIGRYRKDEKGDDAESINVIDSASILRAIVANTEVTNDSISVRNYLSYDDLGMVQIEDMRFLQFKTNEQ
ncbi:MAG: hypothetical protein P1U56_25310 [Saprospiraceae bacterium]|nr:hypothetical protein [Saprospiraceae bacterium]